MKLALFSLSLLFLAGCKTRSDVGIAQEPSLSLVHPIRATYVGILRDGGTIQVIVVGSQRKQLEIYIDHSISTSQNSPEDLGALWINAYPKQIESNRIEFESDEARTILTLLESSFANYSKGQVQQWSAQNEDLLRTTIETIKVAVE